MSTFCSAMTTPFHGLISLFFSPKHDFVTLIQQTKVLSRKKDRYIRSDKAEKPAKGKGDGFCVLLTKGTEAISLNP